MRIPINSKLLIPIFMFAIVGISTSSIGLARLAVPFGVYHPSEPTPNHHFSARVIPDTAFPTWVNLIPTGGSPPARNTSSAVYDPISDDMTIFGGALPNPNGFPAGCQAGLCLNDVWVLTNADGHAAATWTQLNPVGGPPSQRVSMTAVNDPGTNSMIVFGGDPNAGFCNEDANDVWVLTSANGFGTPTWTQLNPVGALPSPRQDHDAVYDVTNNRMIIFGGFNGCTPFFNDVWVLSNANGLGGTPAWTQLAVTGTPPSARAQASAVYDPNTNRMILFGGSGAGGATNDVWVLADANGLIVGGVPHWMQLSPGGGPSPRSSQTAAYDAETNKMFVFAGVNAGGGTMNDVWELSHANGLGGVPTWHMLSPAGGPPGVRENHTSVYYNPSRHRMTIFSGDSGGMNPTFYNDVWVLTDVH